MGVKIFFQTIVLTLFSATINTDVILLKQSWEDLEEGITLRYFSPNSFTATQSTSEIWEQGGDITCHIQNGNVISVSTPSGFDSTKTVKILTHGFSDSVSSGEKSLFVDAWMDHYKNNVSVILVDWSLLAKADQISSWTDYVYDAAARNCIDVGAFVGLCLAELSYKYDMKGETFHLVGHSLGSHVMGTAGRTFASNHKNSERIGRITGLDPAGPRFVDGEWLSAIPELGDNMLNKDDATFVDVIHSNGGFDPCIVMCLKTRCGTILQLGDFDFYPDGGSVQSGCLIGTDANIGGICSHSRSVHYYYWSIRNPKMFPAQSCASVEECNDEQITSQDTIAYMGEDSINTWDYESQKLFHVGNIDCHWSFSEHNNNKNWLGYCSG